MQRLSMSKETHVRNSATQAFEKVAEAEADDARQEIIASFDRMAAHCREWLSANGEPVRNDPVIGMSDSEFVDYTRSVNMQTNVPANIEELGTLNEVYVAEGNLLNKTQRALMEHHFRFNQNPDDPAHAPVAEIMRTMQAFAAKVRGFVLTAFNT
jgi:hypothetical protein